ncbi:MAG: hypothetical protein CFE37_13295 [Alphaproteobacteria bacterium PA4]|nr:MAG: hypothetical protein CFE37_13295 [Alphaproteobacteria bacterium PA4]
MSLLIALALAAGVPDAADQAEAEVGHALDRIAAEALVAVDSDVLAAAGAGALAALPTLPARLAPKVPVTDRAGLLQEVRRLAIATQGTIPNENLVATAVSAMMEATGHPGRVVSYAVDPEEAGFGPAGVGAVMSADPRGVLVKSVAATGAAAGRLRPGEIIVAVDGRPLAGKRQAQSIALIRGAAGTQVTLSVMGEAGKRRDVSLVRAILGPPDTVTVREEGDVAIVRISGFTLTTATEMRTRLAALRTPDHRPNAYVIDLRGNAGGLNYPAIAVADLLIGEAVIASMKTRSPTLETMRSDPEDVTQGLPMLVLVDRMTAAASEVLAAALQESGRARLVGVTTAGRARVATLFDLSERLGMELVTGEMLSPRGRPLSGTGLTPDMAVTAEPGKTDVVLARALSMLVMPQR